MIPHLHLSNPHQHVIRHTTTAIQYYKLPLLQCVSWPWLQSRRLNESRYMIKDYPSRNCMHTHLTTCQLQSRRADLHAAVPLRFVSAGCKPAKQEHSRKSTNLRAAQTNADNRDSGRFRATPRIVFFLCEAELSLHSGAYFADIILQKRSKNNNVLFSPKTLFTLKGSCARSRCSLWARVFCL